MAAAAGRSPPPGGEAARRRSVEARAAAEAGAGGAAPMKYVLVSGGVVSGLGKGVTASSVGVVLKGLGFRCTAIKIGAGRGAPPPRAPCRPSSARSPPSLSLL